MRIACFEGPDGSTESMSLTAQNSNDARLIEGLHALVQAFNRAQRSSTSCPELAQFVEHFRNSPIK